MMQGSPESAEKRSQAEFREDSMVQVSIPKECAGHGNPKVTRFLIAGFDIPSLVAAMACLLVVVDAAVPQIEMLLLGGRLPLSNVVVKFTLLGCIIVGLYLHPRLTVTGFPITAWTTCVVYLAFETVYLAAVLHTPLIDIIQSYNGYYLRVLVGPAALVFRQAVPERLLIRYTAGLFAICAGIGILQHLLGEPLVTVESAEGIQVAVGTNFLGSFRAFGLCSTPQNFGLYCTVGGALGVALIRERFWTGISLTILAAIGCFVTLVRQWYLLFPCVCLYSAIMTFGKKPSRGLWEPLLFFAMGAGTLAYGVLSWAQDGNPDQHLANGGSLIERLVEWTYFGNMFLRSTLTEQLLGLGIVQNNNLAEHAEAPIDNLLLGIVLHIGIVGLVVFGFLLVKMWLYLRRESLLFRQPFITAVASEWAILWAAGIFYHGMLAPFGALFVLVILCSRSKIISTESFCLPQ